MIEIEQEPGTDVKKRLPDGWRWARLADLGHFDSGGTPSKDMEQYWGGAIPFVTGADITAYYVSGAQARARLTEAGLMSGKTAVCEPGTILFVTRTRVGRVGIATEIMGASQDLSPYVCGPQLLPDYACWYIRSIAHYLLASCRGSTVQGLTREFVESLRIPLAPIPEQRRIAAILREQMAAVERARAAAEAQIAAAKALPPAYLRAVFESDEAREWPVVEVSDLCSRIDYGYTASADFTITEPRFLRITDIQAGNVNWGRVPGCEINARDESANALHDGDIVFARTGGTTGKSFLIKSPPRAVFASYLIRLEPNTQVSPEYLYAFFQSDGYWGQIRASARGGAQPNVNATLLGEITLPVPEPGEQRRITAMLNNQMSGAERTRRALEEQLDAINQLPAALLRWAFIGEL